MSILLTPVLRALHGPTTNCSLEVYWGSTGMLQGHNNHTRSILAEKHIRDCVEQTEHFSDQACKMSMPVTVELPGAQERHGRLQ